MRRLALVAALGAVMASFAVASFSVANAATGASSEPAAKAALAEGDQSFQLGRFEAAIAAYERAFELDPRPAFLYNIALAHRRQYDVDGKIDHLLRARELYRNYLRSNAVGPRRAGVEKILVELDAKISTKSDAKTDAKSDAKSDAKTDAARPQTHGQAPGDGNRLSATSPAPVEAANEVPNHASPSTSGRDPASNKPAARLPPATALAPDARIVLDTSRPGEPATGGAEAAPSSNKAWFIAGGALVVAAGVVLALLLVSRSGRTSVDGPTINVSSH